MQPIHRKVLAVIVGVAAILGVSALSLTASLGPDQKSSKTLTNGVNVRPAVSPAQAHAQMLKARALLAKQKAAREKVRNTPRRTVTVVRTLPSTAVYRPTTHTTVTAPTQTRTQSAPTQSAPATTSRHDEGEHSNRHEESDHGGGQSAVAQPTGNQTSHGQDD